MPSYSCFKPSGEFSGSTSYFLVPPATRRRPSGRNECPAQKKSTGGGTFSSVFFTGSQTTVLNVPLSKVAWSLPEPATNRTLPVRRTAAWTERVWESPISVHRPYLEV